MEFRVRRTELGLGRYWEIVIKSENTSIESGLLDEGEGREMSRMLAGCIQDLSDNDDGIHNMAAS